MRFSLKLCLGLAVVSMWGNHVDLASQGNRKIIPFHFFAGMDGQSLMLNTNHLLRKHRANDLVLSSSLEESNELGAIHPSLGNLWKNTAMVFGASPDGIGVGTSFVIGKPMKGAALFATNFHVVEPFCRTPQDLITAQVQPDDLTYRCQSLFVLHDVAIDTRKNETLIDGSHPWKSEIKSLVFFDKKRDLAVFKIALPLDFEIASTTVVADDAAQAPTVDSAENKDPNSFDVFMVYYSVGSEMIKKTWLQGAIDSVRYFENDKKLGLFIAIKHTIETGPGSSGAPLALSDGRIIGVNAGVEVNQFYARSWRFWKKLETYLSYYAIPVVFLKPILTQNSEGARP